MRYLRLADKDIALDRAMIPLGSCTMKLNATSKMMPVSWPEFSNIHPFAPVEQVEGYMALTSKKCSLLSLGMMLYLCSQMLALRVSMRACSQSGLITKAGVMIIAIYVCTEFRSW